MPDVEGTGPEAPVEPVADRIKASRETTEQQLAGLIAERDRRLPYAGLSGEQVAIREGRIRSEAYELGVEHGRLRQADRDQREGWLAEGARIGRAQAEAERPFDFTGEALDSAPSTYDAAAVALDRAVRLVHRIDVSGVQSATAVKALIDQQALGVTLLADELLRWLSEHVEPEIDVDQVDGPMPAVDEVQWAVAPRCTSCGLSVFGAGPCSDPWCPAVVKAAEGTPELVEDGDGAPLAPEAQPCPECRAGKHDNCGGRVPDEEGENLRWKPCPCAAESHPESLG